jgi:hypothetical protein
MQLANADPVLRHLKVTAACYYDQGFSRLIRRCKGAPRRAPRSRTHER